MTEKTDRHASRYQAGAEKIMAGTVDLTPTWTELVPVLVTMLTSGGAIREVAIGQMRVMARAEAVTRSSSQALKRRNGGGARFSTPAAHSIT